MACQSPMKFENAKTVQDLLEVYGDHMYCLGKSYEQDGHIALGAGAEIAEQFWSRLRELVPVEEDEARNYIGAYDVFEGMRIRMFRDEDDEPDKRFIGATGVIVLPDTDGCPGVHFDDAYSTLNDLGPSVRDAGVPFTYISIENAERIDDDK